MVPVYGLGKFLDAHAGVEASALRALDLRDKGKVCAILYTDDQVFVVSSASELQRTMRLVSEWMRLHGALLHVALEKTVVFALGMRSQPPRIFLETEVGCAATLLVTGTAKKRLRYMWDVYGGVQVTLSRRLAAARGAFATLFCYVQSCAIPILFAMNLFLSKIDGKLTFFRLLYMVGEDSESQLVELEEQCRSCATCLLGPMCASFATSWA